MKKVLLTLLLFLVAPSFAHAFSAELLIDAGKQNINALEVTIHVPQGIKIDKVYSGDSILSFWITQPVYDEKTQTISFAGITPGGFQGKKAILSLVGKFSVVDLSHFTFSGVRALKNDGTGQDVLVKLSLEPTEIAEDQIPPEIFKPVLSKDQTVFEGRPFLSFNTQDKQTGIGHYEYASSWFLTPADSKWMKTDSPLPLSHAMLFKKIFIRAIDQSGNARVVSILGPYYYYSLSFGAIILLCVLLFARRFLRSRS